MNHFRKGSPLRTQVQELLRMLRAKFSWLFRKTIWIVTSIVAILGIITALLDAPEIPNRARAIIPYMNCWSPVPMDSSKFTIAMSPFLTIETNGNVHTTGDGRELARLLYTRLEASFEGLSLDVPYELRSPDQTCVIKGATREERSLNAEEWATRINADVLIYGAILKTADNSTLQPEFYVTYRGFTAASDLVGPHELGRPLRIDLPVQANALEGIREHPVNARAQALSLIALGLASYVVDDHATALDRFIAADEVPNWPASAGKEMLYTMMGNTASRLASTTLDNAYVDEALDYYDRALEINPDFERALVGEASALYQLALGNLQTRQGSQVDLELLEEAESLFHKATALDAPVAAEIPLRVHLGLGQIYLVRHYLQAPGGNPENNWLERARTEFQAMIDSYLQSGARNQDLVGHAYARLALIASQIEQNPQAAIPLYQESLVLVTPRWQAQYQIDLGDVYGTLNDAENARLAYEEARAVAELYGNEELVDRADERIRSLRQGLILDLRHDK